MDLFEYIRKTEGLENSLNFAIKYGLLPDKTPKKCIKCGKKDNLKWTKSSRNVNIPIMFICAKRQCRSTITMSKNTLFDRINFPLSHGLRLIYFWLMKLSARESSDQLKLSESTVNEWYQFFTEVCAFIIINYTQAIGGPGQTIELKEYYLQKKEESYDVWMITGIDRNTGQNFAVHVEVSDIETLWPIVKNYILPGSLILTERYREFAEKEKESESPSLKFVHPNKKLRAEGDYHLDGMWSALVEYVQREIPPDASVPSKELYAYQFLYFNRDGFCGKPASELILPFLSDVKQVYPGFEKDRHLEFKKSKRNL